MGRLSVSFNLALSYMLGSVGTDIRDGQGSMLPNQIKEISNAGGKKEVLKTSC